MKAVLISIQPKWCELIASGKKTVEVRKTKPKLETPFKVYIYCTKGKPLMKTAGNSCFIDNEYRQGENLYGLYELVNGKVIGEFVCEDITDIRYHEAADGYAVGMSHPLCDFFAESTCLKYEELHKYLQGNKGYGWHISDLVIYDKPRELSEFRTPCKMREMLCGICDYAVHGMDGDLIDCNTSLERPPESWCYVEVSE